MNMNIALPTDIVPLGIAFIIGALVGALVTLSIRRTKQFKWWPWIVALALLGVALFLIPSDFERLALFSLVAVTMAYAVFTYQLVNEVKEQRLASLQPVVLVKSVYMELLRHELGTPVPRKSFTHFAIWNTGNGPAIEMEVALLDEKKDPIEAHRETYLRPDEEYDFKPSMIYQRNGKHYIVCQFKRIEAITGSQSWDRTWLPIELSVNKKQQEVNVIAGELEFEFGIRQKDKIDVFTSKPK